MDFIKKFIINSVFDFEYDNAKDGNEHHLIVGSIDNKYGILDNQNKILLPFEYDNITRIGMEILQTCKSGKLGIVKIESDFSELDHLLGLPDRGHFSICNIISCEFDSIILLNESLLLLQKYHHTGRKIWAYFAFADKLTENYYSNYKIVNENENLINMYGHGRVYLIDYSTGDVLRESWGSYYDDAEL